MAFDVSLWSLDFDGCLFNRHVLDLYAQHRSADLAALFIRGNKRLLDFIIARKAWEAASLTVVMNGSNRQSVGIDLWNGSKEPVTSVFDLLPPIANAIDGASLDAALLSDVFCGLEPGESWAFYKNEQSKGASPGCPLDDSKILLLFSQIQHAASRYLKGTGQKLAFHFVDDRPGLLDGLNAYCKANPQMLPEGVTLFLHHYDGDTVADHSMLEGHAVADDAYRSTVFCFTHAAGSPVSHGWGMGAGAYPNIDKVSMARLSRYRDRVPPHFAKIDNGASLRDRDHLRVPLVQYGMGNDNPLSPSDGEDTPRPLLQRSGFWQHPPSSSGSPTTGLPSRQSTYVSSDFLDDEAGGPQSYSQ